MKQKHALDILKTGDNVFLTGPPGSGKTYLLNTYIEYLRENDIPVSVTASTGVAATHMKGRTIHSWSGIGIKETLTDKHLKRLKKKNYIKKRIRSASVLIIDEISMLHSYQFDMIDMICREVRGSAHPFGGLQLVCSGDLFQLPPVKSRETRGENWAVESRSWNNMDIKICYLDGQFRHIDKKLIKVLKDIRTDSVDEETTNLLMQRINKDVDSDISPTRLYTHNNVVSAVNAKELKKIDGDIHKFEMRSKGDDRLIESLKRSCLSPETLSLKLGAKVMFTKNNFDKGYVNGTMGKVVGFDEDDNYPIVEIFDGNQITVEPDTWRIDDELGEVQAQVSQIPLRLSWAVTVHKSQGMTLDAAEMDLSRSFEEGMGYVALSRIRSLDNLKLKGFNDISLKVSDKALRFDEYFRADSEKSEKAINQLDESRKDFMHDEFIEEVKNSRMNDDANGDSSDSDIDPDNLPF